MRHLIADGLGFLVVLRGNLPQTADAHLDAFRVHLAHRRDVGLDGRLGVGNRPALRRDRHHRSRRQLRDRRNGRQRTARAAARHRQGFLENFVVVLLDRVPPKDVERRRAVADPLSVHRERRFVAGVLHQFAHLLRIDAVRIGNAVDLDAELLFEDFLGLHDFLAQVSVHAERFDVAFHLVVGRLVHAGAGDAEVRVVIGVGFDVDARVAHFAQLVPRDRLAARVNVVHVNEHRERVAEFLQDRPRRVVAGDVAVVDGDDRALGRDVLVPPPPREEILHGDHGKTGVLNFLHLLLELGRRHRQGIVRTGLFLQAMVAEDHDRRALVDRGTRRAFRRRRSRGVRRIVRLAWRAGRRLRPVGVRRLGGRRARLFGEQPFDLAATRRAESACGQERGTERGVETQIFHRGKREMVKRWAPGWWFLPIRPE